MKITGKNTAVGSEAEDIITAGGLLTVPTTERIHAIVSDSPADDYNGTLQVETATVVGTIAGRAQVITMEVLGTVGASGAGNIDLVVAGALVTGTPLTIPVAVANNDTASQVATKIRTALDIAAVTTHYTVGGTGANVTLTAKVNAANDVSLHIEYDNDTASGLNAAGSETTTEGFATGAGLVNVIVTGALVTGSPLSVDVAVAAADNASAIAGKIRTALNIAAITAHYTVSGATDKVILTAQVGAANDETLNIAVADGTSNGVTEDATSTDTTAGIAPTGARSVEVTGINLSGKVLTEVVRLNGTAAVNTVYAYLFINSMDVKHVGTGGKNAGTITATAATDNTVTSTIEVGKNKAQQAIYAAASGNITNLNISAHNENETEGTRTDVELLTKKQNGGWKPELAIQLFTENPTFHADNVYTITGLTFFKIQAIATNGESSVVASFDVN